MRRPSAWWLRNLGNVLREWAGMGGAAWRGVARLLRLGAGVAVGNGGARGCRVMAARVPGGSPIRGPTGLAARGVRRHEGVKVLEGQRVVLVEVSRRITRVELVDESEEVGGGEDAVGVEVDDARVWEAREA